MIKRPMIILLAAAIAALGFVLYFWLRVPPGVEPKGSDASAEIIAWLGLAGGIVSLMTSIVGLMQKIIEMRASKASE